MCKHLSGSVSPQGVSAGLENGWAVAFMTLHHRAEETRLDSESSSAGLIFLHLRFLICKIGPILHGIVGFC